MRKIGNIKSNRFQVSQTEIVNSVIPKFDGDYTILLALKNVRSLIDSGQIKAKKIKFNSQIRLEPKEGAEITFMIPDSRKTVFLESSWGCTLAFSLLPFEDLIFLLTNILLEVPIIINSEDQNLLTSVILTLISLIKPFKWPFSVFFSLHHEQLDYIDSPVPIIIGLKIEKKHLSKSLQNTVPRLDAIYVDLDFNEYRFDSEFYSEYVRPSFGRRIDKIGEKYKKNFCKREPQNAKNFLTCGLNRSCIEPPLDKESLLFNPTKSQKAAGNEIAEDIYKMLTESIVDSLPLSPIISQSSSNSNLPILDIKEIGKAVIERNEEDEEFFSKFVKRQMFEIFVYMHYQGVF